MKQVINVMKRELLIYFVSPLAYAIMALFLLINGMLFSIRFVQFRFAELDWLVFYNRWLLLIIAPLLTMRLISEERRNGTFEMVMTSPVTETQWILGKFFGVFVFYLIMIAPTILYVSGFYYFGAPGVDYGMLGAAYLGLILHGAMYLAVGLFFSSTTSNQVLAALFTIVFIFLMLILPTLFASHVRYVIMLAITYISFGGHESDFRHGIASTRDIIYLISITALFLYMAVRVVSWRRWVT